jgi:hypothetical protein
MYDELLDIATSVLILEIGEKRPQEGYIGIYLHAGFFSCLISGDGIYYSIGMEKLIANNLAYVKNGEYELSGFGDDVRLERHRSYTCPTKEFFEIREIYNS